MMFQDLLEYLQPISTSGLLPAPAPAPAPVAQTATAPTATNMTSLLDPTGQFIGDPRILDLLGKLPQFASLADQYRAFTSGSSGGDMPSVPAPDFSALKGYTYGNSGNYNETPGSVSQHYLYDPTGKLVTQMDYQYDPGMSDVAGVLGVLGIGFGLPYAVEALGGGSLLGTAGTTGTAGTAGTVAGAGSYISPGVMDAALADATAAAGGVTGGAAATGAGLLGSGAGSYISPGVMDQMLASQTAAGGGVTAGLGGSGLLGNYISPGEVDQVLAGQTAAGGGVTAGLPATTPYISPGEMDQQLANQTVAGGGVTAGLPSVPVTPPTTVPGSSGSTIPSWLSSLANQQLLGSLIGGLLGRATAPKSGGTTLTPYTGAPMKTPQFKPQTWNTVSQGMPGGLGSQSAGLFDQYMQSLLAPAAGSRMTIPRAPQQGPGTY
jgi:hypothetical protein